MARTLGFFILRTDNSSPRPPSTAELQQLLAKGQVPDRRNIVTPSLSENIGPTFVISRCLSFTKHPLPWVASWRQTFR